MGAQRVYLSQALLHLGLQLLTMVEVAAERGVNLSQGQVGMLKVDLLRAPAVGDHVQSDRDDLRVGLVDSGHAPVVEPDVGGGFAPFLIAVTVK